MKKEMNNKGFSLVELIIVVAIMAVLIGVLAPTYLKYVESSKKTSDCSAIGSIMDAVEVIAVDPSIDVWNAGGEGFEASWTNGSVVYSGTVATYVEDIAAAQKANLKSKWASKSFQVKASKTDEGTVEFTLHGDLVKGDFADSSKALEARFD